MEQGDWNRKKPWDYGEKNLLNSTHISNYLLNSYYVLYILENTELFEKMNASGTRRGRRRRRKKRKKITALIFFVTWGSLWIDNATYLCPCPAGRGPPAPPFTGTASSGQVPNLYEPHCSHLWNGVVEGLNESAWWGLSTVSAYTKHWLHSCYPYHN